MRTIWSNNFCLHYYTQQLLYALLKLATFVYTTAIQDNFCMYYCYVWKHLLRHYCNRQLNMHYYNFKLFCTIEIDKFCTQNGNWHFLCAIAIDKCFMLYGNCEIFYVAKNNINITRDIDCNIIQNPNIACIQLVTD